MLGISVSALHIILPKKNCSRENKQHAFYHSITNHTDSRWMNVEKKLFHQTWPQKAIDQLSKTMAGDLFIRAKPEY
jgi:hypothetical protein